MATRAEKRQDARAAKKDSRTVGGISYKELSEAEAELLGGSDARVTEPATTFGALLDDWHGAEATRESLRVQYARVVELKRRGRPLDPDKIVQQYAQAKQDIQMIEDQMVEFLKEIEDGVTRQLLTGRHLIPNKGYIWEVPKALKSLLAKARGLEDEEEDPPSSDGTENKT